MDGGRTPGLQCGPRLGVLEQLAVEDDREAAVLVADRLAAVGEADDAEPAGGEGYAGREQVAVLVRPAVPQGLGHRPPAHKADSSPRKGLQTLHG